MKVRERVVRKLDVNLYALLRLPLKGRLNMRTVCDHCGKEIEDEYFLGGFADNHRNMKFHEACVPEGEKRRLGFGSSSGATGGKE